MSLLPGPYRPASIVPLLARTAAVLLAVLLGSSVAVGQEAPPPTEWLAVTAGGLHFELNDRITIESQRLYLTPDQVRVRYSLMNTAETETVLFVGFPFPSLPEPQPPAPSLALAFNDATLKIEGEVEPLHGLISRVFNDGREVTDFLEAAGIDLLALHDGALNQLSRSEYRKLERALTDRGEPRPNRYGWSLHIEPQWRVTLPSRGGVELELSYTPYTGLSVDRFTGVSELNDLAHVEAYCASEQPDLLERLKTSLEENGKSEIGPFLEMRRRELSYRWEQLPESWEERTLRIEVSDPRDEERETPITFCFPGGIARLPDGTHLAGGYGKPKGEKLEILFFE